MLFGLAGSHEAQDSGRGQELLGGGGKAGIGLDFQLRALRPYDAPSREEMEIGPRLVLSLQWPHRLGVAKPPPEKSTLAKRAQTLPRPAQKAENGAAVVADKIHRAVKPLSPQGQDDRPAFPQARAAPAARETPDALQAGKVLEHRDHFLGDHNVKRAIGEELFEGAQGRGHEGGVAKVTELYGQGLHADTGGILQ